MATVTSASAVTMPGSELVMKLAPSTTLERTPVQRTATHAIGNARTVVATAASAQSQIVCTNAVQRPPADHTSAPPIESHRTIVYTGTPSARRVRHNSAAAATILLRPSGIRGAQRGTPEPILA